MTTPKKPMSHAEQYCVDHIMKDKAGKAYPFDQCLIDRKADGYSDESAQRICGAIKAGTVHKSAGGTFTTEKQADGSLRWAADFEFAKKVDEEHLVYGIVYEPDVIDAQDDSAGAADIEKAAHNFMINSQRVKIMHKENAGPRVSIVESYIAHDTFRLGDQMIRKGSWVLVVKIHDEALWQQVKKGDLTGFSMGGRARAA